MAKNAKNRDAAPSLEAPIANHPSFYALPPDQQLFVELARGYMAYHGKIAPDVMTELAKSSRRAAEEMGWE